MLLFYMVRKENQNMKIKRLLAAVLSLAMGVSMMTACGSSDSSSKAEKRFLSYRKYSEAYQ